MRLRTKILPIRVLVAVLVSAIVGGLFFTFTLPCTWALCRWLQLYTHEVVATEEYQEHLRGVDLRTRHSAQAILVRCGRLRDRVVRDLHGGRLLVAPTLGLVTAPIDVVDRDRVNAWRVDRSLHLENKTLATQQDLDEWAAKIRQMRARQAGDATAVLPRLFDNVILHVKGQQVTIPDRSRYSCP